MLTSAAGPVADRASAFSKNDTNFGGDVAAFGGSGADAYLKSRDSTTLARKFMLRCRDGAVAMHFFSRWTDWSTAAK